MCSPKFPAPDDVSELNAEEERVTSPAVGAAAGETPSPALPDGNASITLEALHSAMAGAGASGGQPVTPTIGELLHPDVLKPAFESEAMAGALPTLLSLLPEQDSGNRSALGDVLRSPALRSQAGALTNAMASGGVQELLASFGLPNDDPSAAVAVGAAGLQVFFRALKKISKPDPSLQK